MHDARDPKQVVTYLSERGLIIKQAGAAYLRMDKGHIVRRLDTDAAPQIIVFDRYVVDLNQLEQRADQPQSLRPRERYTAALWWPPADDVVVRMNPGSLIAELHDRFANPLYAFAFVLVVVALMGQAQTTRQNRMRSVIAAFAIGVLCRILGIAAANAVVIRPAAGALLYVVPVTAAVVAAMTIQWHLYPRPPSRLARRSAQLLDAVRAAAAAMAVRVVPVRVARRTGG
jgi:lipopolysaccharide export system permease protein